MSEQDVDPDVSYPGLLQPGVDDKLIDALKSIIDQVEMEELTSQDKAVQEAKKREFYWQGIQAVFWDEVNRRYDEIIPQTAEEADALAKIVNVYKADGETFAAAIASSVPQVRFYPADADNPDDILAAKAETKLSQKIAKDNHAQMVMFQIMYTLWTEPFAAAHISYVEDPSFGYRVVPLYEQKGATQETPMCAQCGAQMGPATVREENSSEPLSEEVDPAQMNEMCPSCGGTEVSMQQEEIEIPQMTQEIELPEGRAVIDIYGISNVRIPFYCRKQEDIPYVFLDTEQHYAMLRDIFSHIKDKILPGQVSTGSAQADYRKNTQSSREAEVATCRRVWLRPWVFELLDEDTQGEELEGLKAKFPNGAVVYYVNDIFACAFEEGIDDKWEFTKHPMSRFIHNTPIGDPTIPLQDMTNEATNLSLDLILNSVPPLLVNPDVVNFEELGNTRQLPGTWIKARPRTPGMALDGYFYQPKPPTFSQYLPNFFQMLDARRQHVGGIFPSVYGGTIQGGSKTKGEYEQSRSMALQRLGIVWKMVNVFWPNVMAKAVRCFRKNMAEDIKDVQRNGNDFVNVWIRKSEMTGRVGRVESESSEEFPVSWGQVRGILIELLSLGIPQVNDAILHAENADFVKKVVGIPELYIPGEDDRRYQLGIIQQLLMSPPYPTGEPTIPPDPNLEDNMVAIQVTQAWLMSEQGLEQKEMNPGGYQNVLAHLAMRAQIMAQQQMMAAMVQPPDENVPSSQGSKPNPPKPPAGPPV